MKPIIVLAVACLTAVNGLSQAVGKRPLRPEDIYRYQSPADIQMSTDGDWIAYVLSSVDSVKDRGIDHIYMSRWDGSATVQVTNGEDGDSDPRWSPDGKYLSFLSTRHGEDGNSQLWLMDRRGGEGIKLLEVKGGVENYAWSPDAKSIVFVIKDPDFSDTAKTKIRKPYVIDRYHFKQDIEGYLGTRRKHLYLFDLATKKLDTLTRGNYNESAPNWNPDSKRLAFVSNRTADFDQNDNDDIFLMGATPGASVSKLTNFAGQDIDPHWSPDGKSIAYLQTSSAETFVMYGQTQLAVIAADGSNQRLLSKIDRPLRSPRWTTDGQYVSVLVEDDRQVYPATFSISDGSMKKLAGGDSSYKEIAPAKKIGDWVTIMTTPQMPPELYALESGKPRRISFMQDSFLAPLELARVEGFQSKSKDGNLVSGLLYTMAPVADTKKSPLILFIHGGPVAQDEYEFDLERQILSAGGFTVAAVNYRGSNGRGIAYTRAIYADWGNKEVLDIQGAANYLVAKGIVDEGRMGIAGWSYGGILTDYTIASDPRFKAASSGAGSALQLSMYGVDEYVTQYNMELGTPWQHPDKWIKLSYPFFKADKIKTPTLFMASQSDFNVPSVGAEQMYQAFRTIGIPTQLIIYPNQFHGITVPSYQVDRLNRWLGWFGKYLNGK